VPQVDGFTPSQGACQLNDVDTSSRRLAKLGVEIETRGSRMTTWLWSFCRPPCGTVLCADTALVEPRCIENFHPILRTRTYQERASGYRARKAE
jgi:hypothetical protein